MDLLYRPKLAAHKALRKLGFDLVRSVPQDWPVDFSPTDRTIIQRVEPYTMTSRERLFGLIRSVEYIVRAGIGGAVVECGVWKGGSMMAAALTLLDLGETRELFLYDTFEGMTAPTKEDVDIRGTPASTWLDRTPRNEEKTSFWAYAPLGKVQANLFTTGYKADHIHFVKGPVEETIPGTVPDRISVLRLDTDWYGSTKHELEHLYPLLSPGGVIIFDDYGFWKGQRQAVDEYLSRHQVAMLLCRTEDTSRIGIKPNH